MANGFKYRLSEKEKVEIAQNLIDILQKDSKITEQTVTFIGNWILTAADEKGKCYFDVWDMVLKNYLPATSPVLFRSCRRICKDGKIASFTGKIDTARRFSKGEGYLIICDTNEELQFEGQIYQPGQYKHTFYPLVSVLEKAQEAGGWGFGERLLNNYIGEDEYIMRIDLERMHCLKWMKGDFEKMNFDILNYIREK